jgi:cytochrome c biogenesis factor
VFGVAVLSTIFSSSGSLTSTQGFVDGAIPALWVGAAVVAVGAVLALALPRRRPAAATSAAVPAAA